MVWSSFYRLLCVAGFLCLFMAPLGCSSKSDSNPTLSASIDGNSASTDVPSDNNDRSLTGPVRLTPNEKPSESPARRRPVNLHPIVVIKTTLGDIKIKLNAEKSPITVANFLDNYADRGYYEKTIFHYVDQGNIISVGGYTADLEPKATRGEILNEADNGLKNLRGTVAMARHPSFAKSATSQFFFNLKDNPQLDHNADKLEENFDENFGYCVFGEVLDGMDVVQRIAAVEVSDSDLFPNVPTTPIAIESIRRLR